MVILKLAIIILWVGSVIFPFGCANREMTGNVLLVDDFDDGKDPNKLGGFIFYYGNRGGKCFVSYYNKNPENFKGRYSLRVTWKIPENGDAGFGLTTKVLDITKAKYLCFWLKFETEPKRFWIGLKDRLGREIKQPINVFAKLNKRWERVKVPLEYFTGLDFKRITSISFTFDKYSQSGIIYIDEIKFLAGLANYE